MTKQKQTNKQTNKTKIDFRKQENYIIYHEEGKNF